MSEQHNQDAAAAETSTHTVSFKGKLSIPFDLEAIFTMNYDVSGLKKVLEFILENLGEVNEQVKNATVKSTEALNKANDHDDLLKRLEQVSRELEEKSAHHDQQIADCLASCESNTLNISLNQQTMQDTFVDYSAKLKTHDKQIEDLYAQLGAEPSHEDLPVNGANGTGSEIDIAALDKRYAQRKPVDTAIGRIAALEAMTTEMKDETTQNTNGLSDHDALLKAIKKHLEKHDGNLDQHQIEIDALKKQIEAMSDIGGGDNTNIDATALLRKIHFLEQQLENKADKTEVVQARGYSDEIVMLSRKEVDKIIDAMRAELSNLHERFHMFEKDTFEKLVARVIALENRILQINKTLENFGGQPEYSAGPSKVDDAMIIMINNRISALEVNYTDLRNEFSKWWKQIQDELNLKADRADLEELEKTLMNRLNDIITALTKQFADKAETKKALKLLERQLKNLYDLFMSKGGYNNEDEAMFSKKPLGGFSCASCEKDLVNLHGKKVEFMPWSKLPFRDPAERIARVGQGFSKMLSMINPDQLSGFQHTSKLQDVQASQNYGNMANTASNFHPAGNDNHEETRFPVAVNQRGNSNVGGRGHDQSPEYKRPGSAGNRKNIPRISNGRSHNKK